MRKPQSNLYQELTQELTRRQKPSDRPGRLDLAQTIIRLRKARGLTGAELCRRSGGLDPRTLTAMEKGRIRNPSLENLQRIARGLHCHVRDLFTDAELELRGRIHVGTQRGYFQAHFPGLGLKVISSTPASREFFCGKFILEPRKVVKGELFHQPAPVFLEVVMGRVEVTVEDKSWFLKEGENLFFDGGFQHSLRNPLNRESALRVVTVPSLFNG